MADVVFPAWFKTVDNQQTGVATVDFASPNGSESVGRTSVVTAANRGNPIINAPAVSNSDNMPLIGGGYIPFELWQNHHTVNLIGTEYPEQLEANVPAGKKAIVVGGPRWLEIDDATKSKFVSEHSDDILFADVAAGGKLEFYADRITQTNEKHTVPLYANPALKNAQGQDITGQYKDAAGNSVPYELGGRNQAVITGQGDIKGDAGAYGTNLWASANSSSFKMGKTGKNNYVAENASQGHVVEGGIGKDTFEYNFTNGLPSSIGANKYDFKPGGTDVNQTDAIQLRGLPNGSKVEVKVNAIRGTGTFPDSDVTITIKNSSNITIGTVEGKDVNYAHIIYPNGTTQGISPKSIGAGGTKNITIGTTAPAAAPAALTSERLARAVEELQPQPETIEKPASLAATSLPQTQEANKELGK